MTSFRRQVPHLAISSQPQAARIAAVMVGNLVAEAAVRCRAEPDNLSPGESALSGGDRLRRRDVA